MKKNSGSGFQAFILMNSKETWIIRGLVVLVVLCALMWGLTAETLKYERVTTKQLRLKLQQEQSRIQQTP